MNQPRILYAASGEHGGCRGNIISGGPGQSWARTKSIRQRARRGNNNCKEGLPEDMGKMAIAVCRFEIRKSLRTESRCDLTRKRVVCLFPTMGAKKWSRHERSSSGCKRAWYYIELFTDPKDETSVYCHECVGDALKHDGGKRGKRCQATHGDITILLDQSRTNPKQLHHLQRRRSAVTFNAAKSVFTQSNMPTAQFFRINVDNQFSVSIYAGQQDNTSVSPSRAASWEGGISTCELDAFGGW
jgi:hypothetical protein